MLATPKLREVCVLHVELGPLQEMGAGLAGARRIIPIIGGKVTGQISGEIQNLGADWQTIFADGTADLDTRYALRTDDGALIEIINKGVRHGPADVIKALARGDDVDPAHYYMRTTARLETGDSRYAWVNKQIFVGTGARFASGVQMKLFSVE